MRPLDRADPRRVGRCRIRARLGAGGMATVYFGYTADGRPAAVKVMRAGLAAHPGHRERFRREVAATRSAGGRFSPAVLDADPRARRPWLATEFLPGVTLREAVELAGPLPAASVWWLATGLAEALRSVHRAGLVHLDVSPANVLLTLDGPRLLDFGIAARLGPGGRVPVPDAAGADPVMSPEQRAGGPVGPPSDVYSLGATLAYAATGVPAGGPETVPDPRLRALLERCLRPDPAERPALDAGWPAPPAGAGGLPLAVVEEIRRRVAEEVNPPPVPRRVPVRWQVGAAGVGLVAVLAVGAGAVLPHAGGDPPAAAGRTAPSSPSPSPSPPPSPPPRQLEFQFSGSARLLSLTLTVNGATTTVRQPAMPYRLVLPVPAAPGSAAWSLSYTRTAGEIDYRVLVDGFQVVSGVSGGNDTRTEQDRGQQ